MNTIDDVLFDDFSSGRSLLTTHDLRRMNDELGLTAIAKFGWLRGREIGNVLWPNNPSRNIQGARVARRWIKEGLVIERKLPDHFGSAYVLSKKGAEFVDLETAYGDENDVKTGKKIGDHIKLADGGWIPTHSWRHDLLANGFLTLALGNGAEVFSELELRRESPFAKKIPDGLYRPEGLENFLAIEVERAGKWATNAREIAREIVEARLYGYQIGTKKVIQTVIVYEDPDMRHFGSSDRKILDHFSRIKRQVEPLVPFGESVRVIGIPLQTKGGGVLDISRNPEAVDVGWTKAAVIDKSVFGHDWTDLDEYKQCYMRLFWGRGNIRCPFEVRLMVVERLHRDMHEYELTIDEYNKQLLMTRLVGKLDQVQRQAAIALQRRGEYRAWAANHLVAIAEAL